MGMPVKQESGVPMNPFYKPESQQVKIIEVDSSSIKNKVVPLPKKELLQAHPRYDPPQQIRPPNVATLMPPELSIDESYNSTPSDQLSRIFNTKSEYSNHNEKKSDKPLNTYKKDDYFYRKGSTASSQDDWSAKSETSNYKSSYAEHESKPFQTAFGKKGSAPKYYQTEDAYDYIPVNNTKQLNESHSSVHHKPSTNSYNYDQGFREKQTAVYDNYLPRHHHNYVQSVKSSKPPSREKYSYTKKSEPHFIQQPEAKHKKKYKQADELNYHKKSYK